MFFRSRSPPPLRHRVTPDKALVCFLKSCWCKIGFSSYPCKHPHCFHMDYKSTMILSPWNQDFANHLLVLVAGIQMRTRKYQSPGMPGDEMQNCTGIYTHHAQGQCFSLCCSPGSPPVWIVGEKFFSILKRNLLLVREGFSFRGHPLSMASPEEVRSPPHAFPPLAFSLRSCVCKVQSVQQDGITSSLLPT